MLGVAGLAFNPLMMQLVLLMSLLVTEGEIMMAMR